MLFMELSNEIIRPIVISPLLVSQPIPTEQNFLIFIKDHIDIHECLTVIVKPKLHRSAFYTIMATGSIVLEGFKVSDSKL